MFGNDVGIGTTTNVGFATGGINPTTSNIWSSIFYRRIHIQADTWNYNKY